MSPLELILYGGAGVSALMFALWILHFPLKNAAIVDFGWALGTGMLGVAYTLFGSGYPPRAIAIGIMSGVWGLRLAIHLLLRTLGHEEEGRYKELRRSWKTNLGAKFFVFFQVQALSCVILSLPFLLSAADSSPRLSLGEYLAMTLWLMAMSGEAVADAQLASFKKNPNATGRICKVGLWRYSRHPNYFFEWLIWVAFAHFATWSPYGWLGWIAPALILFFLLRVTGIPATEQQAVRSKGDEYRQYQRTTSAFIPWFPKGAA